MTHITAEKFKAVVGEEPQQDDLPRCNCDFAGQDGHTTCGWCEACDKPRFMCGHPAVVPVEKQSPKKQLASMVESYKLCIAPESPLPELAKGVIRGFFKGTIVDTKG